MLNENQQKSLELAIAALDKEFGKGTVVRLGTGEREPWPSVTTGVFSLDLQLGIGGLPFGRIVEIYGQESSGKSTLCLSVVAAAQAAGMECAYIDAEHALDPVYMTALGIDLDRLLLSQPGSAEEALEILDTLIGTGALSVIVVDSVAALTPRAELDGDMGDSHMGLQARLMGQAMRKINSKVSDNKVLVIFVNQMREKIGVMFGSPNTTPGGKALKFYASQRLEMAKIADIKNDGVSVGSRIKVKVVKNKLAPPLRVAEFDLLHGRGANNLGCVLDLAEEYGIVKKKGGGYYSYNDTSLGQGRDRACQMLASDLNLLDEIKEKVLDVKR